jgi:hypothetical protein
LDYLLQLNNYATTTLEEFAVEYKTTAAAGWTLLYHYDNVAGTFNTAVANATLVGMAGQNFQIRFRAYGANSFNINGWGLDNIVVKGLVPCSGTPVVGTTILSNTNPCPGVPVIASLPPITGSGGMSYQWYSGPSATGPWTPGTGPSAITNTYTVTPPVGGPTYYYCKVTCSSSGLSTNSVPTALTTQPWSPTSPCYCVSAATNAFDQDILNVTVGTLNNTTDCAAPLTGSQGIGTGTAQLYADFTGSVPAVNVLKYCVTPVGPVTFNVSFILSVDNNNGNDP